VAFHLVNQSRNTVSGDCGGGVSQRGGGGVSQRGGSSDHGGLHRHLVCVGVRRSHWGGSQSGAGDQCWGGSIGSDSRSTQVASRDGGEEEGQDDLWKMKQVLLKEQSVSHVTYEVLAELDRLLSSGL
jgi:hypothetical protein